MKTGNSLIHYKSKSDYLNRKPTIDSNVDGVKNAAKEATKAPKEAKTLEQKGKSLGEDVKEKVKSKVSETKDAGKHLLEQAGSAALRSVSTGFLNTIGIGAPSLPTPEAPSIQETKSIDGEAIRRVNKPGIFFVKGFGINPFEDESKGLAGMAANIPSSEVFKWSDTDSIIEAVKSRPHSQPIILVGHGMGGDTAVEVVNRLNTVEHGFRRIDLLVTMDSVGTDNDIIPQNVRENYNLISDQDMLFNDGPNVARNKGQTKVENTLLEKGHNEMETDREVQFLVFEKINRALMNAVALKDLKANLNKRLMDSHRLSSKVANLSH